MTETVNTEVDVKDQNTEEKKEVVVQAPVLDEAEERAVKRGWKPKDKFIEEGGNEADWKPAKFFNEYGDLKEKLVTTERDLKKANKIAQIMAEHHKNVRQQAYSDALTDLKQQRQKALEEQDFATAEKFRDQMDDLKDKFKDTGKLPVAIEREIKPELGEPDPEMHAFMDRNPWYRPGGKDEMSKRADALGYAYYEQMTKDSGGTPPSFKDVIKLVEVDIRKLFPEKFDKPKGVGPAGSGNTSAPSKGKYEFKLTDDEKRIAKAFDMTEEAYAKERDGYKGR